jgi:aldose 1-epimerase
VTEAPFILSRGDLRVEIDPGYGGRVTGFWSETPAGRVDWITPVPSDNRDVDNPHKAGMFPLVPFSNRIRNGCFSFAGQDYILEATEAGKSHAIHGHGCRAAWHVSGRSESSATLVMGYDGEEWPSPYTVAQRFDLRESDLVVHLIVDNIGSGPMPIGLGWHPFFPVRGGAVVTADFKTMWPPVRDSIPEGPGPVPTKLDFSTGRIPPRGLDAGFGGWNGRALIEWPDKGAGEGPDEGPEGGKRLRLSATGPLYHMILYTPPDRDFFCLEPVTHPINAINRQSDGASGGMHTLAAGGRFGVSLSLKVMPDASLAVDPDQGSLEDIIRE